MKKKVILASAISLLIIGAALAIAMELVITRETGFKYEYGLKIVKDNQIIENYIFKDIPIGIGK